MTLKELLDELNKIASDDKEWLDAEVRIVIEHNNRVFERDIRYVAENNDGVITIES